MLYVKWYNIIRWYTSFKNIGAVAQLMKDQLWFDQVAGIGFTVAQHITIVMQREGFVDSKPETWQVAFHRNLYRELQEKIKEEHKD